MMVFNDLISRIIVFTAICFNVVILEMYVQGSIPRSVLPVLRSVEELSPPYNLTNRQSD